MIRHFRLLLIFTCFSFYGCNKTEYFLDLNKNSKISKINGSVQFALGFSIVFVSLGALASSVGSFFSRNATILGQISGAIIIIFGLVLLVPSLNKKYLKI